jgi:cyclophilin family peptidyl-prolyl cis-trans isomerase
MALSGPDTGGSHFFIAHSPQPHLDGGYTVFGRVISGMAAANRVIQDDPILAMRIVRQ